eukprot:3494207-Pyramimonas_sp.AAC.2
MVCRKYRRAIGIDSGGYLLEDGLGRRQAGGGRAHPLKHRQLGVHHRARVRLHALHQRFR